MELSEMLGDLDQNVVVLVLTFLICFAFSFFALKKTIFKTDEGTAGVISAMISFLVMYGVNKMDLPNSGIESVFGNMEMYSGTFGLIAFIFILAGIVFLMVKFAKNSLIIIGGVLILLGLFAYEKALFITLGSIILAIRIFIKKGKWEPKKKTP
jgi:hypothetical protein